jgi:flagellar hook-length control protein FliK
VAGAPHHAGKAHDRDADRPDGAAEPAPTPAQVLTAPVQAPVLQLVASATPTTSAPAAIASADPGTTPAVSAAKPAAPTAPAAPAGASGEAAPQPTADAPQPDTSAIPQAHTSAHLAVPDAPAGPSSADTPAAPSALAAAAPAPVAAAVPSAAAAQNPQATARPSEVPEVVKTVIQLAARREASTARIELTPPELGRVEIRLRYDEDGVSASISSDHADSTQALQQASGDLRRALEDQGLTVKELEVSLTGADTQQASQRDARPDQQQSGATGSRLSDSDTDDQESIEAVQAATVAIADGRVDVLA